MQKELNDAEFLEYIAMTMSREMFPTGRLKEVRVSGIIFNYAYLGAAKGRQRKGCTKEIEQISASHRKLYWNAKSYGKKVVGLVHGTGVNDWLIQKKWIIPSEIEKEVIIVLPIYDEEKRKELEGRLTARCTKLDADYKGVIPFLSSFKEMREQPLEENSEFCMKCLFLFYPSLLNEFCNDLMKWCYGRVMEEAEYAQIQVVLKALSEYLKLLKDLQPIGRGVLSYREIANVLNQHQMQVLSYKMEQELRDKRAKEIYKKCLEENVRRGIRNTYSISNFELMVDQNVRGGMELVQVLWDIKKLAESIRKMDETGG